MNGKGYIHANTKKSRGSKEMIFKKLTYARICMIISTYSHNTPIYSFFTLDLGVNEQSFYKSFE